MRGWPKPWPRAAGPRLRGSSLDAALWQSVSQIDTVRREHLSRAMCRAARSDRDGGEVYVYRRHDQPCHVCGTPISKTVLAGRNLYWCPTCQKG